MPKLKYLFEVEFFDKSFYRQNKNDIPVVVKNYDTEGNLTGSAFTDVCGRLSEVKRFSLVSQGIFKHKYTVDLTDGHFEVDGLRFDSQSYQPLPIIPQNFTLVFYRQHQQDRIVSFNPNKTIKSTRDGDHRIKYFIGWQTIIAGKNYQQLIGIK